MKKAVAALAHRRKRLVAQSAIQRHLMTRLGHGCKPALAWLDLGISTSRLMRHHPWLFAATGVLLSHLPFQAIWRPVGYLHRLWIMHQR